MQNQDSLTARFRATARTLGDEPAIVFADRAVSFAAVDAISDRIAAGFGALGLRKGERIGLYCINSAEFACCYLGIVKAGGVVLPVNLLSSAQEVDYVLNDAGVRFLVYHPAMADKVAALRASAGGVERFITIGPGADSMDLTLDELQDQGGEVPVPDIDPAEDLAAILYTSGTTGRPKGAMLTHRNLVSNTGSVVQALKLRRGEDCLLVVLPMFHSFAATVGMLTPLLHGMRFAPVPRFDPGLVSRTIDAVGATVFLGVPSMYGVLLKLPDDALRQWATIRYGVSGGAAMPQEVMQKFEARFGIPVHEGDGPTECGPVTCVNPVDGLRKPSSVGLPIPDVEIEIFDDDGARLARGEVGEICVRGPNVMKGYWNLPEATAENFFGEWVRTGDVGYRDDDGYLFMVDRKKDMVIVNGMNVYPRMVEEVLYQHPGIFEAAVVGEPHETHGEIPVAYVVVAEGAALSSADVRSWCRERLGSHEVPRKVVFRDDLPKNATGKILKRELRKSAELERGIDSRQAE
jgi:long-chain acyl-CoA synthetase